MSYNIRYDNPNDGRYAWRTRRDNVAGVIRFHRPDVVGLQEALHDQLQDLRERLPSYQWLSAGRAKAENAGEYAAVGFDKLRFNLETSSTFWLSETPSETGSTGWDARFPRLVRYVKLRERQSGTELFHFNTHFDHEGETSRLKSAKLLQRRIDELAPDAPVVVTGDFNCRESEPPYRHLTNRSQSNEGRTLRDARYASCHPHHGPVTTMTDFQNLIPEKKIDYVFVTSDVVVDDHGVCSDSYRNGQYPSDHLPIVARLSLPNYLDAENETEVRRRGTFYRTDSICESVQVPSEDV
jgi:endonuclease/exonuclease/phosphatase family metal-dependent hydrolase